MPRYFVYFSYDGTRYHGWQIQPNGVSVQAVLQDSLSILLRTPVDVTGAGRTDAGVHAKMMVAHFDFLSELDTKQLAYRLNHLLPSDIAVQKIEPVDSEMHARFSALSRTYHYYIHTTKDPFARSYSLETHYDLDFEAMNQAAAFLTTQTDFASFCKTGADVKTTICHLTEARWEQIDEHKWRFVITANRFLRNMVRAVVGTLIEVGRHRLSLDDFKAVVEAKKRTSAGESMPAHALFLVDIQY